MIINLILVVLTSLAHAKESCERRYVFSFSNTSPSYFLDSNGTKKGHSYLILKEIVKHLGCKDSEEPGSFLHIRENFRRNKTDIYGLTTPDPSLDSYGEFVELFRQPRTLIINEKVARDKYTISDYIKDPKITFGTVIGLNFFILPEEKEFLFKQARLLEVPTPPDVYEALLFEKIQAMFSSPVFNYHFLLKSKKAKNFIVLHDLENKSKIGFYLSKKRLKPLEREQINKIVKQLKLNGTIERLAKESISPEDFKYLELPSMKEP